MKQTFYIILIVVASIHVGCKGSKQVTSIGEDKTDKSENPVFTKTDIDENFYFLNANKEKLLGNTENAIRLFKKSLQINPNNDAAAYELSIIAYNMGDLQSAEVYGKKAYHLKPNNEWYAILLADVLQKNNKIDEAIKIYQSLIEKYPARQDLYYDFADCYLRKNKPKNAIDVYNKLEKVIGIDPELSLQKEKVYIRMGEFSKAVDEINKLIEAYPNEARYYGILGELYSANNMDTQAVDAYQKALKIEPENPYINLSFAEYYRQKRDYDKSFLYLRTAFESEELDIDTKVKILLNYYLISEKSEELRKKSIELCDVLIKAHPNEAKVYSISGDFYYRENDLNKAKENYQKAIELDKSKFVLWNQLLAIEFELQKYEDVIKHGNEAVELFPNEPGIYLFLGISYLQLKKPEEAIKVLLQGKNMIIDNKTLSAQFYANLGDAYYRTKQMAESDQAYEEALKINPNDTYVLNNYAYYLSLRKENLEKAEEMSKKSNEIDRDNSSYNDTYGWILYTMGKYDEAREWIAKAIENGAQSNAVILEHMGDIMFKLNKIDEAMEYWGKAQKSGNGSSLLDRKISERRLIE
ncbi:MAG: tetratricopeptide repeat protein [Bacteroidia bacterium]|nr:tetratricopeptide repeat protein [Bacteroidia bacterium]MCZ2248662.1 tetratricopeptide repeat protein [Bacteroidia bacterium]